MEAPTSLGDFNPAVVDPTFGGGGGFFPVSDPNGPGWRCVIVGDDGWKDMSTGNGKFLLVKLMGIEGEVLNMPAVLRLNLQHTDEGSRKNAIGQLAAIAYVTNTPKPADRGLTIGDFINKPFRVHAVKQTGANADKGFTNLADNGIRYDNGAQPVRGGAAGPTVAQPAQPAAPAPAAPAPAAAFAAPAAAQPAPAAAPPANGTWGASPAAAAAAPGAPAAWNGAPAAAAPAGATWSPAPTA